MKYGLTRLGRVNRQAIHSQCAVVIAASTILEQPLMTDLKFDDPKVAERYNEAVNDYTDLFGEHPPTIEAPIHWDSLEWLELVEDCISDGVPMDFKQGSIL